MLKLTNSLYGKKELFKPLLPNKVTMYVCGITPYADSHVGHGRCYVVFDLLYKVLRSLGYQVTYCRNITDIDDKLLEQAKNKYNDQFQYDRISCQFISNFDREMTLLNCATPDYEPRVTDHIPQIIAFIEKLIQAKYAYQSDGDVYFRVNAFSSYGILSKHKPEDLRHGVRINVRRKKKAPLDFVLWKSEQKGTFWQSPWGHGRPGWHIECSALAKEYLGSSIDIHGGGLDLMFPHHENEIAQSEALYQKRFVQYWIHNGLITINKTKMSKSGGGIITLQTLFQECDPMVVRFYFLNHHYRAPIEFSVDEVQKVKKSYQRLCSLFESCTYEDHTILSDTLPPITSRMRDHLCDDLNVVGMFGILFKHINEIKQNKREYRATWYLLTNILGLTLQSLSKEKVVTTPEIEALIAERKKARMEKNWKHADNIRMQLLRMGVELQDDKIT